MSVAPARTRLSALVAAATALVLGATLIAPAASAVEPVPSLVVTEIVADNVGYDDYEYFEVHNTSAQTIELDAAGMGFSYIYADDDDVSRDAVLSAPAGTAIEAGETVVFWLSYQTSTVDSFARSEEDFRAHFAGGDPVEPYRVVRVEGQAGMANGGDRGIRVTGPAGEVTRSFYPAGSVGTDLSAQFRLPAAGTSLDVLATTATPTPGILEAETLVPAEATEPAEPVALAMRDLLITEFQPNNVGADAYEYVEIANTTDRDIDLAASGIDLVYDFVSGEKSLSYPDGSVVPAGGVAVLWLTYAPNTDGLTADDFRAFYGAAADLTVIPIAGQAGFANTADRGLRIESAGQMVTAASYAAVDIGNGVGVDYRLPARGDDAMMSVLAALVPPTPGVVVDEAFVAAPFVLEPDPDLVTAPLQITEVAPDTANLSGADAYEFVEVFNATSEPIDFRDYSLKYLYPLADLTNSSTALWPATNRGAVIPAGGTVVFWIKNGLNDALTAADFNAHFGVDLVADENLFEIASAGMANSAARGLEIVTNTGIGGNRAYYNLGGVDDTVADQPIQYAVDAVDPTLQTKLGTAAATPGRVHPEQVAGGLMIVPADAEAPSVTDLTVAEIAPGDPFQMAFEVSDDVQVRTVTLAVRSNLDEEFTTHDLLADGDTYRHSIPSVDLTGKQWFEYVLTARDGTNQTTTDPRTVPVDDGRPTGLRLNLEDGAWVSGEVDVVAATDRYPADVSLEIDGASVEAIARLESAPMFAFEASGVDTFFRNGVRVGDDVLRIFDDGIYSGWETISTPVPLGYLDGGEVTVSVWAGTKAAPEIDLDENNDDFTIRNLRLVLPDGRTLTPAGYDDPTVVLAMGDSAGKLDFFDAVFGIPDDARTAASYTWDTAAVADGPHEVRAVAGESDAAVTVVVDNTAPTVTTDLEEGRLYQGEFMIDASAADAGSGLASLTATLNGTPIELPYATSSISLGDGAHSVVFAATDEVGNVAERTVSFDTPVEEPGNELLSPDDATVFEEGEEVALTARATDPTGDLLQVEFAQAHRLTVGSGIDAYTGAVTDAAAIDREERRVLTAEEAEQIGRFDEVALAEASDTALPYQLFDVAVPEDAGDAARVRVRWDGSANANAKVLLYALGADGSWHELDRALTTGGAETSFTLDAVVPVVDFAVAGTVRVLVQHSEGFAGTALSTRETSVEPNHPEDTPRSAYDFTLAWESDTQYYNEEFHQHQTAIHDYLLAERSDLNLQYLFHTGDIVDDYDQLWQWDFADPEYAKLDQAGLPYGVIAGNHDVGHKEIDYTNYGTYFGDARFAGNPWFGGSYENNRGHYDLMTVGGIDFLMLYMGWGPGDAEIAWMNDVLAQYPERVAMINLHEYMLTTGGLGPIPQRIYDEVIATNPNVRTVFSGHYHDAFTRVDGFDDDGDGVDDRQVYQILFDYQGLPEGGQGYLRLLHFDNVGGQIIARTYSPSLGDYNSDDPSLEPQHQDFTIPYTALGIVPQQKVLATDAFRADVLTANVISSHADVASGSEVTALWQPEVGTHGWYVTSRDPHGATADSEVRVLTIETAQPGDGEPGDGEPGDGEPGDGDGGSGAPGDGDSGDGDGGSGQPGDGEPGDGDGGSGQPGDGRPREPSVPVELDALDPALEGAIATTARVRIGDPFTVAVGEQHAGGWVQLWLHSTPTALGTWTRVAADGSVQAVMPAGTETGVHTLVAQTPDRVLGWTTLVVEAAAGEAPVTGGTPAGVGDADGIGALPATGADAAGLWPALAAAGAAAALGLVLLVRRRRDA
jgi:LPXTG-motif cell wall-anchored protein